LDFLSNFDFSVFTQPGPWVQLLTLIFLEMVLGIDNLVFIAITTDRLPDNKKHIGRRLGLIGALVMRIILLTFASWIISLQLALFTLPFTIPGTDPHISGKDLILLVGGAYLVYKGIKEIVEKLRLEEEKHEHGHPEAVRKKIGLPQAVATIMMMDIIFSLDSVITAVGLASGEEGGLLIMILAVMIAVIVMIIFADPISEFINSRPEIKLLALTFIVLVGIKLVAEALGIEPHIAGTDVNVLDVALYFAMGFSLVLTFIQMSYNRRLARMKAEAAAHQDQLEASTQAPGDKPAAPAPDATPNQE
jgi:predicted tellurium resistance membrane protein TerC